MDDDGASAAPSTTAPAPTTSQQPTLRPARSISSVVARPLSILSTRSLHRREPATDPSTSSLAPPAAAASSQSSLGVAADSAADALVGLPAGSRASFSGSTRNSRRDSRGLLAAQVEMNFEEALRRDDTLRLSSTPSTAVAPAGDNPLPDSLRSSLDRPRPISKAQGAGLLAEEEDEELLADMFNSTDSSDLVDDLTGADSDVAEAGHVWSGIPAAEPAKDSSSPHTTPSGVASVAGHVTDPGMPSPPRSPDGDAASILSTGRRVDRKPPPSAFSPPIPSLPTPSHARLSSPRPSLTLVSDSPGTPPPPGGSTAARSQPGIIPPSPSVQPPTPTHPPPEIKRRRSSTPSAGSGGSPVHHKQSLPSGDIPRAGSSLDLASLAKDDAKLPQVDTSPMLSSHDTSSTKSTTSRPLQSSTFMSPPLNDVAPQTPPKPSAIPHSDSSQSMGTPASLARSPSGGMESDMSTDDWEKLGLSPSTPSNKALAPESAGTWQQQQQPASQATKPAARQVSYGLGAGIGSTSTAATPVGAGSHRGDGFRSMRTKARSAFSKMFSSPSHARTEPAAGPASGSPKKSSPRHFGSMSSSNLASYGSSWGAAEPSSPKGPPFAAAASTLPSRSSSHNSLIAARGTPPLPEIDHALPAVAGPIDRLSSRQPASIPPERSVTEPYVHPTRGIGTSAGERTRQAEPQGPPANGRRRSMSVSDAANSDAPRSWEYDVEGLLDGIIGNTTAASPRRSDPRATLSTSSSPRHPAHPFFGDRDEGTTTTTITAGTGKATRSIVGSAQRVLSPPPIALPVATSEPLADASRPSSSSTRSFSDLRSERRPSIASTSSSLGTTRPDETRTGSPCLSSSPTNHSPKSLAEPFSFHSSASITPSSSAVNLASGARRLPAIPASPSGQSFGLSGSPYTISSPLARTSSSLRLTQSPNPTVDLSEDVDVSSSASGNAQESPHFRGQTIRLVPASPSPRLPPLPNSSPMATPSKFIVRRASSSESLMRPGTPTRSPAMASRPLIETLDSVGLGIVDPISKDEVVLGDEIILPVPEEEALEVVRRIRDEDESLKWVSENRVAEFLGGRNHLNRLACKLYMSHIDFFGQKLDAAIRTLTSELYFRAETQELDRIIEAFSERYFECNLSSVYGSPSVIHQVVYGLLLLNTDLHVADHDRRMTRSQFVDNVLSSIRTDIETLHAVEKQEQPTPMSAPSEVTPDEGASHKRDSDVFYEASSIAAADSAASLDDSLAHATTGRRNGSLSLTRDPQDVLSPPHSPAPPPPLAGTTTLRATASPRPASITNSAMFGGSNGGAVTGLRKDSVAGSTYTRAWFNDMETTLKDLYSSVKTQQILQPMDGLEERRPSLTLSPSSNSSVSRARSLRTASSTSTVNKRTSIRGFGAFGASLASIGQSTAPSSFGGRLSPTPTYATSMHDGFDPDGPVQSAPGFASNLKHTVIKETDGESVTSSMSSSTVDDLLDEELALLGAPWAKEGMISRKIYLDSDGKRAKDKVWRNLFTVVGAGNIQMYTFENTSSSANKGTVGGGNWLSNAHLVDDFSLAHCVAKVLPAPGYNRARPHVFTLDQPNGAQSFFQVGTDSLADEWTSTCNYRSARVSKEPLTGGVSNMEYGWGRHTLAESEGGSVMSARRRMFAPTPSIMEWKPPQQPLYPSQLDEETQLEHLRRYAVKLLGEMEEHVSVEKYLVPIRQPNGLRAHDNYRRKLKFLHEEQFKYKTYIAALEDGLRLRMSKRGEIRLNKTLEKAGRRSASRDD